MMILTDSNYKLDILKGGGLTLQDKIYSVWDLKTGITGLKREWIRKVSERLRIAKTKITAVTPSKTGNATSALQRNGSRLLSIDPVTLLSIPKLPQDVNMMFSDSQNPFVGNAGSGLFYSVGKKTWYGNYLWETLGYYLVVWHGKESNEWIEIDKKRYDELWIDLKRQDTLLSDIFPDA